MLRVLFVCAGNICRSPLAEALFRHRVQEEGLQDVVSCDSAGTGAWHVGEPPCPGTLRTLKRLGISSEGLVARQVRPEDLTAFDYILAMDRENLEDLHRLAARAGKTIGRADIAEPDGGEDARIELLLSYAPEIGTLDVNDPYYNGRHDETYRQVAAGVEGFWRHLKSRLMQDGSLKNAK